MMRKFVYIIAIFATVAITSCSTDEPDSPVEQPVVSDNIYLEFNKWVYSKMNEQYLWREDLPDSLDCDYNLAPKEFFNSLLSSKDRFSYFTTNSYYKPERTAQKIGFAFQSYVDKMGQRAMQVLYVNSASAQKAGLHRGDFVNYRDVNSCYVQLSRMSIEDGIFAESGEVLEFTLDDYNEKNNTVLLDSIYNIDNHNIGYLCYLEYGDVNDLYKSIERFSNANISELILDLRYNPGGYVSTCQYLCNSIVPTMGYGAIFQQCSYNDILANYFKETTGDYRTYTYFDYPSSSDKEMLGAPIIGLNVKRLFVITSKHTASASEATIICLRPYMDVITIGEKTVGKGVGSWTISESKYRYAIQPITMRYYNANGESTPDDGIEPDFYELDGYAVSKKEIGDINEHLLNQAISLITSSRSCRTISYSTAPNANFLTPIGEPSYVTEFKNKQN